MHKYSIYSGMYSGVLGTRGVAHKSEISETVYKVQKTLYK